MEINMSDSTLKPSIPEAAKDSISSTLSKDKAPIITVFEASYNSAVGIDVHLNKMALAYQRAVPESQDLIQDALTTKGTIEELNRAIDWIATKDPEVIIMESTGVYWVPLYLLLEERGLADKTFVLNAYNAKTALGKKSDASDAKHLAQMGRLGAFVGSFIPCKYIRDTRIYSRHINALKKDAVTNKNRLHKLLNMGGIKASTVFSDIRGVAARTILDAVMRGDDAESLKCVIADNCKRLKAQPDEISQAISHLDITAISPLYFDISTKLDQIESEIERYEDLLYKRLKPYYDSIELLTSIPGISQKTACTIISELGDDWSAFTNSKAFCSWVGLAPGNNESAGKRKKAGITKGNKYIRKVLIEAAQSVYRMKSGHLKSGFDRFYSRLHSYHKAVVAIAHKMLRIAYALMTKRELYKDPTLDCVATDDVSAELKLFEEPNMVLNLDDSQDMQSLAVSESADTKSQSDIIIDNSSNASDGDSLEVSSKQVTTAGNTSLPNEQKLSKVVAKPISALKQSVDEPITPKQGSLFSFALGLDQLFSAEPLGQT